MARLIRIKEPIPVEGKGKRASHIYRVAAEILCQKGYEATSMNDIAEAAGLTKAGIYHYIRGKEDLLFEIMNYAMDVVDQGIVAPASQIENAEDRLRAIIQHHARSVLEGVGALTVVLEEVTALTPAHRRTITARKRAYFEFIRGTLEQLERQGRLRPVSPTVAAFSLLGMILWISRWYRRDGAITTARALHDYVEIGMHAVLR
jgi:AcrR family transcriptional regulator